MQLSYRGIAYHPTSAVAQTQAVKLIYRGQIFERIPHSVPVNCYPQKEKIIKLIYRGHTYDCTLPELKSESKPYAINWRFRLG